MVLEPAQNTLFLRATVSVHETLNRVVSLDFVSCRVSTFITRSLLFQVCLKRKTRMPGSRTTEPHAQQSPHGSGEHSAAALRTRGLPFPLLYLYLVTADTKLFRGVGWLCCYFQEAKPTSCYPSPLAKPTADGAAGLRPTFCPRIPVPDGAPCTRGRGGRAPVTPPPSITQPAAVRPVWQPPGEPGAQTQSWSVPSDPRRSEQRPGELRFTLNLCFVPFLFIPFQISLGFRSSTKGVSPRNFSVKIQTAYWTIFKF